MLVSIETSVSSSLSISAELLSVLVSIETSVSSSLSISAELIVSSFESVLTSFYGGKGGSSVPKKLDELSCFST